MATARNASGDGAKKDGLSDITPSLSSQSHSEEIDRKARVDAMWEKMNGVISTKTPTTFRQKPSSNVKRTLEKQKPSNNWMTFLGLAQKEPASIGQVLPQKRPNISSNNNSDEVKRLAAAALSAVKDAALASSSGRGKAEIVEIRDFAGEEIEVKRMVDADSKEASERAKSIGQPPSAVDAILEQIKKKPKLSVLDKTKKDWGEFKDDNKGMGDELDAYKKSSNQYLDKVSFLERTDYREFEKERDARLASHLKRRPSNMQEDP